MNEDTKQAEVTNSSGVGRRHYLSLGVGVQSVTLAHMHAIGELPPIEGAIFANPGRERKKTYAHLDWLEQEIARSPHPFPIYRVSRGDLWAAATRVRRTRDGQRTYIATGIPVYTMDGLSRGIGMRQCTRDFKISVINAHLRKLVTRHFGIARIRRSDGVLAQVEVGISIDEADRMKPSQRFWIENTWPLIELGMSRADCQVWLESHGYPIPPRSSCTFCPFHSDDEWLELEPHEFQEAVEMERELQAAYAEASVVRAVPFLHRSRVPLSQVKLRPTGGKDAARQLNMFRNECTGFCGV